MGLRVVKMLARDRWDQDRFAVPIHRALYRLQAKGMLTLTWYANRKVGCVRLNVAMKEKVLTSQQLEP